MAEETVIDEKESWPAVRKQLLLLGCFVLSENLAWSSTFPYIYAMVESISGSSDSAKQNTAFYASLLVSVFTLGEFLMAPQWARISDKIGRKPTLLIGSVGAIFSAITFGLSSSLPMAIVARTFAGMLNPNLGIVNTFVAELVSREKQARGFSIISFLRSIAFVSGPIVGGYLAEPARKLPSIFPEGSMWQRYPYLLPNLVIVVGLALSCFFGFLYLQEVHPRFRYEEDIAQRLWNRICKRLGIRNMNDSLGAYAPITPGSQDTELSPEGVSAPGVQPLSGFKPANRLEGFTKQVVLQILSTTLLGFVMIGGVALFPIFLGTPRRSTSSAETSSTVATRHHLLDGGYGLNTEQTSNVLLSQAIFSTLCQIFVVPQFIESCGVLRSYRIALMLGAVSVALMPFCVALAPNEPGFSLGLVLFIALLWAQSFCNGVSGTSTSIMLTNNCPAPIHLATINGVAVSASCLARTAGPATLGALLEAGLKVGNVGIAFWTLAGVSFLTLVLTVFLREHKEEG